MTTERKPTLSDISETASTNVPEEEAPATPTGLWARVRASWRFLSVAFGLGLLLGWIVLGWLVLPVKWVNTDPWDLRPEYQERYLSLVAEEYWRTSDLRRAIADLEGWDETALVRRLASMEAREQDPEKRRHIAALAEALKLPEATKPFWVSLLSQKTVLFSMLLPAFPMMGAIVLVLSARVRREPVEQALELSEEELTEEELEQFAALAGTQLDEAQSEEQKTTEEKKAEETVTPEATEEQGDVADLLSNLFDDDNESLERLQSLSKGLDDLDVDAILKTAREMLENLCRIHALRYQAA